MPTDSGTNDILSLGFLHYTTAVSLQMSDEPPFGYEKTTKKIGGFHFAERTRFELVVRVTPHAGLANRWYKPLTHLSGPAYTP